MAPMTYVRKHPKSGVYEFRRAVPEPLIGRIGKRAIRRSLGTRDFTEAKRLAHPIASEVERLFRGKPEPARDAISHPEPPPAALAARPVTAEETERRAKLWLIRGHASHQRLLVMEKTMPEGEMSHPCYSVISATLPSPLG